MRTYLLLILLQLQQLLHAQIADSVVVMGRIMPDSGATWIPDKAALRLISYSEEGSVYTAPVNPDGSFNIKVAVNNVSLYDLKYKGYKVSLLLSSAEPFCKVIIRTDARQEVHLMKITGSHENDAYRIYRRETAGFKDLIRDVKTECTNDEKSCFAKFKKQLAAQNELMDYLKVGYKGTYVARVLADLAEVPELSANSSVLSQLQSGFFNSTNFSDVLLYQTPDLNNKISAYLEFVADTSSTGRFKFVQNLMARVKAGTEAQKQLLTVLFNNFLDNYRQPYIQTLAQWANNQPSLNTDQPVLAAKLKLVANLLPGMPAPDVTGENLNGQIQTLLTNVAKNKITLLIFWESDCPHCRKAMPDFTSLYKQYQSKGLEVFAVSLDANKDKWKAFIASNQLTWTNVVLPENSNAHADYFIQYTPTVALIDNHGRLINRFIAVEDLEKIIVGLMDTK
jgi:peroxiredoxin